ncbi:hypothetical protein E1B28_006742 [Marasmius oreades]|uniref:MARVEL domain-containing protein n=1 Tax=Marasmius oreades TaxID=181124 RepID=A0A9P7UWQ3_9AGAR|nr:uncharacterized protein E1B28_006742 [Marasmius oreades]KAG7096061.1 hypothetical protein E1B28_006742 [Marasmius oreades]
MAHLRAIRLTLYGFMLAFGIIQTALAAALAIYSGVYQWDYKNIKPLFAFSTATSIFALLAWIWISVLTSYNNKTGTAHVLTTAFPHFLSVTLMSTIWLAFGIMILTGTKTVCDLAREEPNGDFPGLCILTVTTGTVTMVLWLLATGAAFAVHWTIRKSGDRWCKIFSQDGDLRPDERVYGPMPRKTALRTTLYSLILFFAICEDVIGPMFGAAFFFAPRTTFAIFKFVAALISLLTWIWVAVLLSYNRRPSSNRGITKAAAHFYSLLVLCILWLAVGIMFSTEAHYQCTVIPEMVSRYEDVNVHLDTPTIYCSATIPSLVLSLLLFALTGGAAFFVYHTTRQAGASLIDSNVAQFDGELPEAGEQRGMVAATTGATGGSQVSVVV